MRVSFPLSFFFRLRGFHLLLEASFVTLEVDNMKRYAKCPLCGLKIDDPNDLVMVQLSLDELERITKKKRTQAQGSIAQRTLHFSCLNSLDVPTRRKLLSLDFTVKFLNIWKEIYVRLDEYGEPIWSSLWSDNVEIDKEIQRLKEKVTKKGIKSLSLEEKKWLESLNDEEGLQ